MTLSIPAIILFVCTAGCAAMAHEATLPATQLPFIQCTDGDSDHVWIGNTEYQCIPDPTDYPADPAGNIVNFETHNNVDAGLVDSH